MNGLITLFWKELADNFSSWRFILLFAIVFIAGVFSIYTAAQSISEAVTEPTYAYFTELTPSSFVFLRLFTTVDESLPSFLNSFLRFIVFLVPIVGIALGFDAINSEKNSGTLSRLLSQPIYRDTVINGKFLAGVVTMAIMVISIVMIVAGVGLRMIGVPPSAEEIIRLMAFLAVAIIYGAFWLGLAMLFSIFFRRVATSALASIAIWILFIFLFPTFIELIANVLVPLSDQSSTQELVSNTEFQIIAMHVSPTMIFEEASYILLAPGSKTAGQILQLLTSGVAEHMLPGHLPLAQSLIAVWPQIVSLIALTAVCFAVSYIKFMREEIRST